MESVLDMIFGNSLYLMMIVLIIFLGIAVAGWHFFGNALKAVLRGKDKYPVLIIKRGPNLLKKQLEVEGAHYLADFKKRQAWFLTGIQRKPGGELAGVVIGEDTCIPYLPGVAMDESGLNDFCESIKTNHPFIELGKAQLEIEKLQIETQNAPLANWFGIMGLAVILGIELIGSIILLTSDLMPWG